MKRLLFLLFCALTLNLFAQDPKPTNPEFKMLQAPNTPIFWYNPVDSFVWVYKGTYGWTRLLGETRAAYKYVPYNGATKQVDLGYQRITSKKQLLPLFNGACSIPTILDNGDGSITVGDGEYHLSTRTDGKGTESFLISGGVFSLTDNTTNYLVADYNSGTPILKVITDVNLINETTVIPIYTAYRSGMTLHFQNWDALGVALANKVHQSIVKTQRYRRESGLGISEFPTRYLSIGNGKIWVGAVPVTLDAITTNTDNLRLYYHSGGVWTVSVQSQYNNTQYDDGTNLVTLTANRYAVNWLFRGVESQKHLYVVLGRGDYTLAQAQEAVLPAVPAIISSHATLIGKLIVQRDATTATSIQSAFDVQFSTATPNAHNDLTGRDVADVHPAGSITFTPTGTYTATTVADALAQIDSKTVDRSIYNEIQAPTLVGDLIGLTQTTTTISISGKEDKSNKENIIVDNSTTKYPTVNLLKTYADTKDPSSTNELNSSVYFNTLTNDLSVVDAGGTKTANISVNADLLINGYSGTISVTTNPVTFNWPVAYANTNYYLDIFPHYTETINGKSVLIRNSVYDFLKTTTGFSLKLDTLAGVVEYRASRTINSETPANVLLQSDLTTTVGSPGLDTKIPTEKAVRTALSGVVVTETDPIYSASTWFSTINNSTNWNTAYTDRLKWDGGSTGLAASTGRTSLGGTTIGQNIFTLTNPSAITFPRFNADNTVTALSAADFKTAIGAGNGTVTQIVAGTGLSGGTITTTGTIAVNYGTTASTAAEGNDSRLSDERTPTNTSVSYAKVATDLVSSGTVTSTIDLSARAIGYITLSANTAFTFTNYRLNKSYLLIVTANGYRPSFATAERHVLVTGNETLGTSGVFYINLICIDSTSGSEKLLTTIMKGA